MDAEIQSLYSKKWKRNYRGNLFLLFAVKNETFVLISSYII
jgi:hypothetical protein